MEKEANGKRKGEEETSLISAFVLVSNALICSKRSIAVSISYNVSPMQYWKNLAKFSVL